MGEPNCQCYFMERRAVERRNLPNNSDHMSAGSVVGRQVAIARWSSDSPKSAVWWCSYFKFCPLCGNKALPAPEGDE